MDTTAKTDIFEDARPQLMGLAYRLLGSVSDAQDAVQDTYIKWISYTGAEIETPPAWLSRVCTNCCLDRLKSAHSKRVDYVGQWIPDQIQTEYEASTEERLEVASSLTTAFLLLLERLTPKERAAYLLHDIFGKPFDEIATVVELQPANCRKLAARARGFVAKNNVRYVPEEDRQNELLLAFRLALETGDTTDLGQMLRADSDLRADSGGRVVAVREVLEGKQTVCTFVSSVLSRAWASMQVTSGTLNGMRGLLVQDDDVVHAAITFSYDQSGNVRHIYIMRNPQKLALMAHTKGVATRSGALRLN
jgi:RNA polymerase sigma-70 factor (ECF subfamily)